MAFGMTLIERSLLSNRPVFFVSASRRGGGKTTALMMWFMAVTGAMPPAAAWSTNEEERRKALITYLMNGVPGIVWDNIARGSQVACIHIERSCTAKLLADRKLGVNENIVASAATVHAFCGNNIIPYGDLASRSLRVEIDVDRADPENRPFAHSTGASSRSSGSSPVAMRITFTAPPITSGGRFSPRGPPGALIVLLSVALDLIVICLFDGV
jgi:hypothetical protein